MNLELLIEAERRGLLPDDKKMLLAEARKRGMVPEGGSSTNSEAVGELKDKLKAMAAGGVDTASLGLADEATGLIGGLLAAPGEGTFKEGYAQSRDAVRAEHDRLQGQEPGPYGAGQIAGGAATLALPGATMGTAKRGAGVASRVARSGAEGAAFGGVYGFGSGEGQEDRLDRAATGGTLGGIVGALTPAAGAGIQKYLDRSAQKKATNALINRAPSVDDLKGQAAGLYDDAAAQGVSATPAQTAGIADKTAKELVAEGLTGPSGQIAPGYASAAGNQALLMDFADSTMNPKQMQAVRKALMETARKPGSEGRIGSKMVSAFDETTEPLAPQIKQGNAVYSKAMKSEKLAKLQELAKEDAGVNYTSAGYEQALRRRFSNLKKKIIEGKEQGWTPDEIAAIDKVANGGKVENVARNVGRAAPTGIMNIGIGGGMPYLIGNSIGGPAVGAAMGAATMGAGALGRKAATAMQSNNAAIAQALAATGEKMPNALAPEMQRKLIEALIRRTGSTVPQ